MKLPTSYEGLHCANCGASMQGEFCHACGQSIHSVLKPVHGMIEETVETVLHIDGRIVHTLPPLLLKPGFLTLEYFSGRRVRYIAPFRLMFVLCLLAFFVSHIAMDQIQITGMPNFHIGGDAAPFARAHNAAEVQKILHQQLANVERAHQLGVQFTGIGFDQAKQALRLQATQRLIALGSQPAAAASATAPATTATTTAPVSISSSEQPGWLTEHTEVHVRWLPDFINARMDNGLAHFKANALALKHTGSSRAEAYERIKAGMFGVLPQTLFVMIPVFALLLKLFYVFRRRLYMEHLIVALHSHAFLFLGLLLATLLHLLRGWLTPHADWLAVPLGWLEAGLWLWAPAYLLIMQKRVYRQGWPMTVLKFWFIGWCYFWLLLFALAVAFVVGMAH